MTKTITFDETKWKLVPIEPNEVMLQSAKERIGEFNGVQFYLDQHYVMYKAMISAAPTMGEVRKDEPSIEDFLDRLIRYHNKFATNWYIIGIVDGYRGHKEENDLFEYVYIKQSGPLTDAGDDFCGNCYIEISEGKYLKTEYYT